MKFKEYKLKKQELSFSLKLFCKFVSGVIGLSRLMAFLVVAYTSAIFIAETFITVMMKKVLAAGISVGLVSENNIPSMIAGWGAPSLFMIFATFAVWSLFMYKYWYFLSRIFGRWQKLSADYIYSKQYKS